MVFNVGPIEVVDALSVALITYPKFLSFVLVSVDLLLLDYNSYFYCK